MLPMTIPRPRRRARPEGLSGPAPKAPRAGSTASKPERPGAEGAKSGKHAAVRRNEADLFAERRRDR